MKKFIYLSIAAFATLASCGAPSITPEEFVNKVKEQRANLSRPEYNTLYLSGSIITNGIELKSTDNSVCKVTWDNGVPSASAKKGFDPFLLACFALTYELDLTEELASSLSIAKDGETVKLTAFSVTRESSGYKSELKWSNELLLTSAWASGKDDSGADRTMNVTATWKNE